ncbi:CRISPR-associated endonuclease Cas3'' [Pyrococcus horikoshii]|nr:CRISPR-associated endonuclease Cas3'' [Pyrococcus horikoshii]
MEDHIRKGLEIIEGLYLRRGYGHFLSKILNIDVKLAEELLKKAYIFHDIGKCLEEFQQRREKFRFHEVYSALVAREVFKKYGDIGGVVSVAILLHHHNWIREKSPKRPRNLKLCNECLSIIKKLSGEKIPEEIPWRNWIEFTEEAEEIMRTNLRGVYSILLPLVVADNYAAAVNRGGKKSALGKEIFEVLKVRGWKVASSFSSRF